MVPIFTSGYQLWIISSLVEKQGKKVCKVTAVRCLFVFVCWHRGEAMWLPEIHSYIGELLTAADRCKNVTRVNPIDVKYHQSDSGIYKL